MTNSPYQQALKLITNLEQQITAHFNHLDLCCEHCDDPERRKWENQELKRLRHHCTLGLEQVKENFRVL